MATTRSVTWRPTISRVSARPATGRVADGLQVGGEKLDSGRVWLILRPMSAPVSPSGRKAVAGARRASTRAPSIAVTWPGKQLWKK